MNTYSTYQTKKAFQENNVGDSFGVTSAYDAPGAQVHVVVFKNKDYMVTHSLRYWAFDGARTKPTTTVFDDLGQEVYGHDGYLSVAEINQKWQALTSFETAARNSESEM